ncbi:unnamed protein product [Ceratitis capitata]|uniref:(Mediterranean fruit fly) hypothetical protein n=1 Tax=Ceratitis capitata TaxID=7213 RepID=A0A811UTJ2_CERCA|nr:unnamed protein product [Ceratitis capitata]
MRQGNPVGREKNDRSFRLSRLQDIERSQPIETANDEKLVRANLGINTSPSAYEIQYIVAWLVSMQIVGRKFSKTGSNCGDDDDINLDWNVAQDNEEHVNLEPLERNAVKNVDVPDEHFANVEKPGELQVKRYYTGCAIYNKVIANCDAKNM